MGFGKKLSNVSQVTSNEFLNSSDDLQTLQSLQIADNSFGSQYLFQDIWGAHVPLDFYQAWQRTEVEEKKWRMARMAKITASVTPKIKRLTRTSGIRKVGDWSGEAEKIANQIIAELFTGKSKDGFQNNAMKWGNAIEPMAAYFIQERDKVDVIRGDFVTSIDKKFIGSTVDYEKEKGRIIGEIKCPESATHIQTIRDFKYDPQYKEQLLAHLAVNTKAEMVEFSSFDPRQKDKKLQLFTAKLYREEHEKDINDLTALLCEFNNYIESIISMIYELV